MKSRWNAAVSGQQVLTYTVDYEAEGSCYYDPGNSSGPVEACYEAEGEAEITKITYAITDSAGETVDPVSALGIELIRAFNAEEVLDKLMESNPGDSRED